MTPVQGLLLAGRVLLETGVVAGLAWAGYAAGGGGPPGILLAIAAPAVGFGIWGAVDFRQAGRLAEPLRLIEELVISALAAAGVIATGHAGLGWALIGLSLVYHLLVYAAGERLLKAPHPHPTGAAARQRRPPTVRPPGRTPVPGERHGP